MKLYFGFSRLTGGMTYYNLSNSGPAIWPYTGRLKYILYDLEYPDRMLSFKELRKIRKKLW